MVGYHANDKERCSKFINEDSFLVIDDKDTDFLGKGMYFWEHQSRAEWWLEEKNKEFLNDTNTEDNRISKKTENEVWNVTTEKEEKVNESVIESIKLLMTTLSLEGLKQIQDEIQKKIESKSKN